MKFSLFSAPVLAFMLALSPALQAAEPDAAPSLAPNTTLPARLLAAADVAIAANDLARARSIFEQVATRFPGTPEANEAIRALRIMSVSAQPSPSRNPATSSAPTDATDTDAAGDDVIVRDEPYSRKTSERLRLSIWEKVDFSVTSFLYGMSVGASFAISQHANRASEVLTPVALGAIAYTLGSVAFLKLANPDRGDLPLALAITSYVPTTALLITTAAYDDNTGRTTGAITAIAGIASVPIAVLAARNLTLDPGDMQLVRDAGFWGLALSTIGMLGFGGNTVSYYYDYGYSHYDAPSGRKVAVAGLIGLYGGLGLGLLGASNSEVSLERVRVSTWGGYGGGVVGLLLGAAMNDGREQDMYRGAAIGALAGLVITFLSTGSLDGIPSADPAKQAWHRRLTPMMVPMAGKNGSLHTGLGLGGTFF
jgi:hypothetical protein